MTSIGHSYGPTCSLYVESNTFTRRASSISDAPPKIRAQFFYASALPIDDPLSPLPPPSTSSSSTPSKVPPRPFSVRDNAALEEAWQGLQLSEGNDHPDKYRQEQMLAKRKEVREENTEQPEVITKDYPSDEKVHVESSNEVERKSGSLANIIKSLSKEKEKSQPSLGVSAGAGNLKEKEKSKLSNVETVSQLSSTISGTKDESNKQKEPHLLLCDDPDHIPSDTAIPINSEELTIAESESGLSRARSKRHRSPFHREVKVGQADDGNNSKSDKEQSPPQRKSTETQYGSSPSDRNTTGTPFLRAPSRRRRSISSARESGVSQTDGAAAGSEDDRSGRPLTRPMFRRFRSDQSESHDPDGGSRARSKSPNHNFLSRHKEKESRKAYVPVDISRLHLVEMPDLQV